MCVSLCTTVVHNTARTVLIICHHNQIIVTAEMLSQYWKVDMALL